MKKALVTLTIGDFYKNIFSFFCTNGWKQYCDRFGYELIVIDENLDRSQRAKSRSPAWQKLLILSQEWSMNYDRILWLDTDIIINNDFAYDIADSVPLEKVGAVDAYSIPTREIHDISLSRMYMKWDHDNVTYLDNKQPSSYYTNRGIPGDGLNEVVQTGVFICSPKYHKEIFESTYFNYEDTHGSEWNYEMPAISFELIKANMVHWISPRFNFNVFNIIAAFYPELLFEQPKEQFVKNGSTKTSRKQLDRQIVELMKEKELACLRNIYDLSIFMHFAGCVHMMFRLQA
jgi:hypothetical protein